MKRLLMYIGFTYLLCSAVAVLFSSCVLLIVFTLCLTASCVLLLIHRKRNVLPLIVIALTASLALGSFYVSLRTYESDMNAVKDKDVIVTGTLSELPYEQYGKNYYVIDVESVKSEQGEEIKLNGSNKARLSSQVPLAVESGSKITVQAGLYSLDNDGYGSASYYRSRGITMFGYIKSYKPITIEQQSSFGPTTVLLMYKQAVKDKLYELLPTDEASLLSACVLGERRDLSTEISDNFSKSGLYHILCVSGLHLSLVSMMVMIILTRLGVPRRICAAISIAFVLLFMLFTGMSGSVTRSGIMMIILLLGSVLRRRADPLNSLGAAVFIICFVNPFAVGDTGLLLSFASTLGILLLSRPLEEYKQRALRKITIKPLHRAISGACTIGIVGFSATLFTLPVLILTEREVSLISLLTNIILLPVATLMIQIAFLAVMLCLIPGLQFIFMPLMLVAGLLGKLLLWATSLIAKIPFVSVSTGYGFVILWLMMSLIMLAFVVIFIQKRFGYAFCGVLSAIVLMCGIFSNQLVYAGSTTLAVLDVGEGTCVVVSKNGSAAIIGCECYSSSKITDYLSSQSIKEVQYIQLLTGSSAEKSNAEDIVDSFNTSYIVADKDVYLGKEISSKCHVRTTEFGSATALGNVYIDTQDDYTMVTLNDVKYLITGSQAIEINTDADVLITENPESSYGDYFAVVISTDEEGLSETAVTERSTENRIVTYATAGQGDIILTGTGDSFSPRRNR